jgi:hypothetical protein
MFFFGKDVRFDPCVEIAHKPSVQHMLLLLSTLIHTGYEYVFLGPKKCDSVAHNGAKNLLF